MKQGRQYLHKKRARSGFTMVELLAVVAIIAILGAVAVGGLLRMRRDLRQKELDAKAELIYAAAQNRMAELRATGYADVFEPEADNSKGIHTLAQLPEDMDEATLNLPQDQQPTFFWVSSQDKQTEGRTAAMLLPKTYVDESLWNANWIIEYNPKSGQVYAVFYSETSVDSFFDADETGENFHQNMRYRNSRLSGGAKVGYYGGDLTLQSSTTILRPTVSIVNDEELTAHFVCRSTGTHPRLAFRVTITDTDAKPNVSVELRLNATGLNNVYTADLVLDSLESGKQRFYQRFPTLTPGHNLSITVTAEPAEELPDAERPDCEPDTKTTNSLFADRQDIGVVKKENTALIRCRRHLQNLDTQTSHVTSEITAAKLVNDISYRKTTGTAASSFYSFKPILNTSLNHFYGTDASQTGGIFSIRDLYIANSTSAGLFDSFAGSVEDLILSNTRIRNASSAGALIGTVTGTTTLKNCWVYLNNLPTTKYSSPEQVEDYIRGTYAGGLVGSVNSGALLTVEGSAAATVVSAYSGAAGGVAGVVRGSLTVKNSYTDCYLKGDYTGGMVGVGPNAVLNLTNFYTSGYQVANTWAAGIIPGSVGDGTYKDGYCAVTYTTAGSVYTTAGEGKIQGNVFYLEPSYRNTTGSPMVRNLDKTQEKSSSGLSDANLTISNAFTAGASGSTTAYDFLDQGLTNYPYPRISGMRHYGDWEAPSQSMNFVYYERYADGSYGVYGSGLKLSSDKTIVGDGYGILMSEAPVSGDQYQIVYTDKSGAEQTTSYPVQDCVLRKIKDINDRTYYLITATPKSTKNYDGGEETFNPTDFITDKIRREEGSFYYSIRLVYRNYNDWQKPVVTQTYYFNPYFAKTVVQANDTPENPSAIYLRTARHLVALSNYFSEDETQENGGRHDFPGLMANTSAESHTFYQERTIDLDTPYQWENYAHYEKPTSLAPIGGETYRFNASYDGQCREIRNFPIRSASLYTGLFGYIGADGTVENVVLSGGYDGTAKTYEKLTYVSSGKEGFLQYSTAQLRQGALAGQNAGLISNCAVSGYQTRLTAYERSYLYAGGLVGVNAGTITNSSADTPIVQLTFDSSSGEVGGLVGRNLASGTIRRSYAFGTVTVEECTNADVSVAGLVGGSDGSIADAYCGVAFDVSGDARVYGFAPISDSATVERGYYFDGGTYSYAQKYYSFNVSGSAYAGENAGKAISAESLSAQPLNGFGTVYDAAHTGNHPNTDTEVFEYPSSVTAADGMPAHYGNWPNHEKSMGSVGVFYWEYEQGGRSGYHLSFLGYDTQTGKLIRDNTLCTAHDDGGVITSYGYGYFLKTDGLENADISTQVTFEYIDSQWNIPQSAKRDNVAAELHNQLSQYQFVAFETGNGGETGMYLTTSNQNGSWQLTYNGTTYTYSLSPFFANAMSLDAAVDAYGNSVAIPAAIKPGQTGNPYQIRSASQLQFINWNWEKRSTDFSVTAKRTGMGGSGPKGWVTYAEDSANDGFPYLVCNADSAQMANAKKAMRFLQSHDLNAYAEWGASKFFTPIGSLFDKAILETEDSEPVIAYFGAAYDGQAYAVKNIQISSSAQMVGLFGITVGADMSNIVLYADRTDRTIQNTPDGENWYCIGGLVGFAAAGTERNADGTAKASFTNCTVSGYRIVDQRSKGSYIERYYKSGTSVATTNWALPGWGGACIGGLVGATNMNITNCTAVTDISIELYYKVANMNVRVGGIAGVSRAALKNCYAGGSITDNTGLKSNGPGNGTCIWVGGLVGGIVMRDGGSLPSLIGSTTNSMTVTDSYCYVELPEANDSSLVQNVQSIASNGEMIYSDHSHFKGVTNPNVVITNSYCYEEYAKVSDDYKLIAGVWKQGTWWNWTFDHYDRLRYGNYDDRRYVNRIFGSEVTSDRYVKYSNSYTPYLTYGEMSEDYDSQNPDKNNLATFLKNGNKVTTEENGAVVNGKYSFPGGDTVLEGKNYPFPTVLTQKDGTVNVHYGRWPKLGLYWTVNSGTIDLFQDREEVQSKTLEDLSQDVQPELQTAEAAEAEPETGTASDTPAQAEEPAAAEGGQPENPDQAAPAAQAEEKTYVTQKIFNLQVVDVGNTGMTTGTPDYHYYSEDMQQTLPSGTDEEKNALVAVVTNTGAYANNIAPVTIQANHPGTIVIQAEQNGYTANLTVTVTATLEIEIEKSSFAVYEGDSDSALVTIKTRKKDAQNQKETVSLPEDQLVWKTQTAGGGIAQWSIAKDADNPGQYRLTVKGVHAGTLNVPLSATYMPEKDGTGIAINAVNFTVTVKPSIALGLGDGEDFQQVSVPHTPAGDTTQDGTPPTSEDVAPVQVQDKVYLYATNDQNADTNYADLNNFDIRKVTINDKMLTLLDPAAAAMEAMEDAAEEPETGISLPEEPAQPVAAEQEVQPEQAEAPAALDPESMTDAELLAALPGNLPDADFIYTNTNYILTVGSIQTADNGTYRELSLWNWDGTEVAEQWTLVLELHRLDAAKKDVPGSYRLQYARPNTVGFYAPTDTPADQDTPLQTRKLAQNSVFPEDELKQINENLRKDVNPPEAPGYYWVWKVEGNVTANRKVYPTQEGIPYRIVYDGGFDGWTGYLDPIGPSITAYGDTSLTLLHFAKDRTGYRFAGWYTKADGGQQVEVHDGILSLQTDADTDTWEPFVPTTPNEVLKIYAHWTPCSYRIVYSTGVNDESVTGDLPADTGYFTYGEDTGCTIAEAGNLARDGYTFSGWYYMNGETKVSLRPGEKCGYVPTDVKQTLTLSADWTANTRQASLHLPDGTVKDVELTYGEALPELEEKGFLGWSLNGTDVISAEDIWGEEAAAFTAGRLQLYAVMAQDDGENTAEEETLPPSASAEEPGTMQDPESIGEPDSEESDGENAQGDTEEGTGDTPNPQADTPAESPEEA